MTTMNYDSDVAGLEGKVGTEHISFSEGAQGGRYQYNEVSHVKKHYAAPLQTVNNVHKSKYYSYDLEITSSGSASCGPERLDFAISRGSFAESNAVALIRATNKMVFGVQDSGFNLPVFLGELRDLRTVFNKFGKLMEPRQEWPITRQGIRRASQSTRNPSIKEVAKKIANANLFYNFAVEPFLADIEAIIGAHKHILRQIDRLRSIKPVRVRASHVDYLNTDVFDGTNPAAYTRHTWESRTTGKRVVRTWAMVQYHWTSLLRAPTANQLLVDTFGLDQPITAAWELTPWSFLIDYFVDVGSFLNQFQGDTVKVPFSILADGYSIKVERHADVTCYLDKGMYNALWQNNQGTTITGSLDYSDYIRRRGPLSYGTLIYPELKLPNLKQVGNMLSLLIANMR